MPRLREAIEELHRESDLHTDGDLTGSGGAYSGAGGGALLVCGGGVYASGAGGVPYCGGGVYVAAVNALDGPVVRELATCFRQISEDPAIRGAILTGTGKFFSFGFDIPEFGLRRLTRLQLNRPFKGPDAVLRIHKQLGYGRVCKDTPWC